MKFVVVDNKKSDLGLFEDVIAVAMPKCQVQTFTDPLLSAKYICNNPVDVVVLTDEMWPVNGFCLLQVNRKNISNIVIIMLSDNESNRTDAIRSGVDGYFLKPVSAELLRELSVTIRMVTRNS